MIRTYFFILMLCVSFSGFCQKTDLFTNPILAGFYPDPGICRVNDTYYLINSTFAYFPGIPVFMSNDLVNWKQIGHVMDRPEQLNLDGLGVSRGIFAPAINYHDGTYYVVCTVIDGKGNFVVTAKDPAGPWSDPVWTPEVYGIDPSLFFDEDGKAYLVYNGEAPERKPLYDGHRTIRMYEFDPKNLKVTGENKILVNGGSDFSKKPIWIEGPHLYKKDGYYYLMSAEGGTGYDHSEVIFRSKNVDGPYVSYEQNPILTQRQLDPKRKNPITSAGHADLVTTTDGQWWAVFLACRPYEDDYYNTGRETFLAPVKWKDGWPVINPDHAGIQYFSKLPLKPVKQKDARKYSGNFVYHDDFDSTKLAYCWIFLRTVYTNWYSLSDRKGYLSVMVRPESCSEKVNPSFVAHRQQHLKGNVSTAMDFSPASENEKAGLTVFQNEERHYFLCKSKEGDNAVVQLYQSDISSESKLKLLTSQKLTTTDNTNLQMKIEAKGNTYSFYYKEKPGEWKLLKGDVDAKFLSTREAGGFVGSVYALYATSLGKESKAQAYFDWFDYVGDDDVYKN